MKREPVLIVMSALAAAQVFAAGGALTEVVAPATAGVIALAIGAVQAGVQFYVRGKVTPTETK